MKLGSLFSGIDGFGLAAERVGWEVVFQVDNDKFCLDLLEQNFKGIKKYDEIRNFNAKPYRNSVDIVSGGFPCQDISIAGLGEGILGTRSGLWSEMARVIEEACPKYVVIENSPQLLNKGFEKILHDLSKIGYDAEWECLSAAEFGYPHKRNRLWVVAYPTVQRWRGILYMLKRVVNERKKAEKTLDTHCNPFLQFEQRCGEPAVFGVDDGLPKRLDVVKRLGSLGNSLVPDIPTEIFKIINAVEKQLITCH